MNLFSALLLTLLTFGLSGCVLTKLVTVPMRVGAAVISVVPVAGNPIHDGIDAVAEKIDDIPI